MEKGYQDNRMTWMECDSHWFWLLEEIRYEHKSTISWLFVNSEHTHTLATPSWFDVYRFNFIVLRLTQFILQMACSSPATKQEFPLKERVHHLHLSRQLITVLFMQNSVHTKKLHRYALDRQQHFNRVNSVNTHIKSARRFYSAQ